MKDLILSSCIFIIVVFIWCLFYMAVLYSFKSLTNAKNEATQETDIKEKILEKKTVLEAVNKTNKMYINIIKMVFFSIACFLPYFIITRMLVEVPSNIGQAMIHAVLAIVHYAYKYVLNPLMLILCLIGWYQTLAKKRDFFEDY